MAVDTKFLDSVLSGDFTSGLQQPSDQDASRSYLKQSDLKDIVALSGEERAADRATNDNPAVKNELLKEIERAKDPVAKATLIQELKRQGGDASYQPEPVSTNPVASQGVQRLSAQPKAVNPENTRFKDYHLDNNPNFGSTANNASGDTFSFSKEIGAAIDSYQANLLAIPAAIGSDWALKAMQDNKDAAEQAWKESGAPQSFDEMEFGKNFGNYFAHMALQSAPYMLEFMASGFGVGSAAKSALANTAKGVAEKAAAEAAKMGATKEAAKKAGEAAAASYMGKVYTASGVAGSYPSSLGDVLSNQHEQAGKFDLPSAAALAVPYAALNAAGTEGMAVRAAARGLPKSVITKDGVAGFAGRAALTGAEAGVMEGSTEAGQEVMNQLGRMAVDPNAKLDDQRALEAYKESFIAGGLLGGIPGAAAGGFRKAEDAKQNPPAPVANSPLTNAANQAQHIENQIHQANTPVLGDDHRDQIIDMMDQRDSLTRHIGALQDVLERANPANEQTALMRAQLSDAMMRRDALVKQLDAAKAFYGGDQMANLGPQNDPLILGNEQMGRTYQAAKRLLDNPDSLDKQSRDELRKGFAILRNNTLPETTRIDAAIGLLGTMDNIAAARANQANARVDSNEWDSFMQQEVASDKAAKGRAIDQYGANVGPKPAPVKEKSALPAPVGSFANLAEFERFRSAEQANIDQLRRDGAARQDSQKIEEAKQREAKLQEINQLIEANRTTETAAKRMDLLDRVLSSNPQNPSRAFDRALRLDGFRDAAFTNDEKAKIARFAELRSTMVPGDEGSATSGVSTPAPTQGRYQHLVDMLASGWKPANKHQLMSPVGEVYNLKGAGEMQFVRNKLNQKASNGNQATRNDPQGGGAQGDLGAGSAGVDDDLSQGNQDGLAGSGQGTDSETSAGSVQQVETAGDAGASDRDVGDKPRITPPANKHYWIHDTARNVVEVEAIHDVEYPELPGRKFFTRQQADGRFSVTDEYSGGGAFLNAPSESDAISGLQAFMHRAGVDKVRATLEAQPKIEAPKVDKQDPTANQDQSKKDQPAAKTSVVRTYKTKNGKIGARITKTVGPTGKVFYSYEGEWGAGSGHMLAQMDKIESMWRKEKRGYSVVEADEPKTVSIKDLALQEQAAAGWNHDWPFVPADLGNADFRKLIAGDPSLSQDEKDQIFAAGRKLGVVPLEDKPDQAVAESTSSKVDTSMRDTGAKAFKDGLPRVAPEGINGANKVRWLTGYDTAKNGGRERHELPLAEQLEQAERDLETIMAGAEESGYVEDARVTDRIKRQEMLITDIKAEIAASQQKTDAAPNAAEQAAPVSHPENDNPAYADDAELQDALSHLGDVLGDVFGAKLNVTGKQYVASDVLPAMSKVIELLIKKGFKSFRESVGAATNAMRGNANTKGFVDQITPRQWKAAYNSVAEFHEGTESEDDVAKYSAEQIQKIIALPEKIKEAEQATNHDATPGQKEAGNYAKGKFQWHGLSIAVETAKGEDRTDKETNGEKWRVTMPATYGYVLGTIGADKDHVDVFMGDKPESQRVYVINQTKPDSTEFDEHKVMLGYESEDKAMVDYLLSFTGTFGHSVLGSISGPYTVDDFKNILESNRLKRAKPISDRLAYVNPRVEENQSDDLKIGDSLRYKGKSDWWMGGTVLIKPGDVVTVNGFYNQYANLSNGKQIEKASINSHFDKVGGADQASKPAEQLPPGIRISGEKEKAAADRLAQLLDKMDQVRIDRNTPEGSAKDAIRSVIQELRKPRTVVSVVDLLDTAAQRLLRQYAAFSDVASEVAESLRAADKYADTVASIKAKREERAKPTLDKITVTRSAQLDGKAVEYDQKADEALKEIDGNMDLAKRLLECLAA